MLHSTPAAFKSFYVVMAGNVEVIADNYYRAAHEVSYSAETDDGERQELRRTTSQVPPPPPPPTLFEC